MAWTYSGNPSSCAKDKVRFLVGDTVSSSPLATDEEITWALSNNNQNAILAAKTIAQAISAKFSTMADAEVGPIRVWYASRARNYEYLVKSLEKQSLSSAALTGVYAGGIDPADVQANEDDTSRVGGQFEVGMHDFEVLDDDTVEE